MVFYALLMEDPTTEMMICWIDEESKGEEQILYYSAKGQESQSKTAEKHEIEGANGYVYHVALSHLHPNKTYYINVKGSKQSFKTFPAALDENEKLKLLVISDTHIEQGYPHNWEDPTHVERFVKEDPDILVVPGDLTNNRKVENFIKTFRDYLSQFNTDRLIPLIWVSGNHEGGTYPDPEHDMSRPLNTLHFRYFAPNLAKMNPVGEGLFYGNIVIGDYLQFIALNTHQVVGTFQDQTNWIASLEPEAENVFVLQHRGFINNESKIYHVEADVEIPFIDKVDMSSRKGDGRKDDMFQVMQREQWFVPLYNNVGKNLKAFLTGHIHAPTITRRLKPIDYTPDHPYYLPAGKYNLVRNDEEGVREFGQGFRGDSKVYKHEEIPEILEYSVSGGGGYPFYTVEIYNDRSIIKGYSYNVWTEDEYVIYGDGT